MTPLCRDSQWEKRHMTPLCRNSWRELRHVAKRHRGGWGCGWGWGWGANLAAAAGVVESRACCCGVGSAVRICGVGERCKARSQLVGAAVAAALAMGLANVVRQESGRPSAQLWRVAASCAQDSGDMWLWGLAWRTMAASVVATLGLGVQVKVRRRCVIILCA